MSGFKDLKVWQQGKKLAVEVYLITKNESFRKDYTLRDQLRRAIVSIPSNIAEGDERGTNKEAVRFFYIAKGSLAELQTQLVIAHEIGYLSLEILRDLDKKCQTLGKMLGSLIKARSQS